MFVWRERERAWCHAIMGWCACGILRMGFSTGFTLFRGIWFGLFLLCDRRGEWVGVETG